MYEATKSAAITSGRAVVPYVAPGSASATEDDKEYRDVGELRREYQDYLHVKQDEINEKRQSRHYYHCDQWTSEELKKLKQRGQPKITKNRIGRKINGVVGLVERLRQDPKAYPRTPNDEASAEIATAVIRYILDNNRWEVLSSKAGRDGAVEGFGGLELELVESKVGDRDIKLNPVSPDTFFYDPRSFEPDFADARFMGIAKWVDIGLVKQLFPDHAGDLDGLTESGSDLGEDTDREAKWINTNKKRVRLVDHWYAKEGPEEGWCYCIYAASVKLMEGHSPYLDEDDKQFSKFIMFSAGVDHDGDRYGFVRNLKDTQDEINHRYSKALHLLNTRRGMSRKGAIDVEKARREAMRPDGWIEWDLEKPEFDDANKFADMQGQLKFLEDAKSELENFGPNPALLGQGIENKSGRAIALLQQAGIAELGPYIIDYKDWKIRIYRAVWQTAKRHWTAERWVRVTDNQDVAQLLQINGMQADPMMGPQTINAIGAIDVDIIIDEGSDTINMMADSFDTLSTLAAKGAQVPPGLLIELAPIQSSIKRKWLQEMEQKSGQPPPEVAAEQAKLQLQQQSKMIEQQGKQADAQANIKFKYDEAAADMQIEREKMKVNQGLQREQMVFDFEMQNRKLEAEVDAKREMALIDRESDGERFAMEEQRENKKIENERSYKEEVARKAETEPAMKGVAAVGEAVNQIGDVVVDIHQKMFTPVEIIRDAQGRPVGVRKGGQVQAVQRDRQGRIAGMAPQT